MVNFPTTGTPTMLQMPSTDAMPLQISTLCSSSKRVARVLLYGDLALDEDIVIPKYDYDNITLEQINLMQEALERKKKQEILRNEYKQKQALHKIKDIFLDAFSLKSPNETKPIMEKLLDIVDQV